LRVTDRLLPYYQGELSYIRRLMDEFARDQPDAAARLRVRKGGVDDPHVARLIEAFAYLTARVRLKLDDEFPEITDAFLNVLHPHYLAPIPSAAVVQLSLDASQGELSAGYRIGRGAGVEISDSGGYPCRFRTCYDVTLWPIEVAACELLRRPFVAPAVPRSRDALGVLRLQLRCLSGNMTFGRFDPAPFRSLRFFLWGQDHHVMPLYELLLNHCLQIAVATSPKDPTPRSLSPDCLKPVGFAPDENLLPFDARSFAGYGLLTDYFAFPHKFLFVDLEGAGTHPAAAEAGQMEVYFFLDQAVTELEPYVTADTLRLGCTPVVNLFARRAEPIKVTHTQTEYPVVPDARQRREIEVHTIDRVTTSSERGGTIEFAPLYACPRGTESGPRPSFWQSHRRPSRDASGRPMKGTDVFLSLVDLDFRPVEPADRTLIVETTCTNRDLPGEISRPQVRLLEGAPVREKLPCLVGPTRTRRPSPRQRGTWSLISHLLLGHLSISDVVDPRGQGQGQGAEALRRVLELYNFGDEAAVAKRIDGIVGVQSRPVVSRLPIAASGFARGIEVTVDFDEERFRDPGQGLYLLASVLEAFFGLYCSINSFTRMTARIKQGERVFKRWPPNAGEKFLL
jgi:type VI secretion system protein ImpG